MKLKTLIILIVLLVFFLLTTAGAENIDPYDDNSQYAYGENIGWFNFQPTQGDGVQVSSSKLTGYVWQENIGWINLWPSKYGGVFNDGAGNLSGYAWGENVGWINFDPSYGGVSIDADGNFDGWAWGENIGWVNFNGTENWSVQVCVVTLEDLQNFAQYWLESGFVPGNFGGTTSVVDMADFAIFASWWKDYCPDGWMLK